LVDRLPDALVTAAFGTGVQTCVTGVSAFRRPATIKVTGFVSSSVGYGKSSRTSRLGQIVRPLESSWKSSARILASREPIQYVVVHNGKHTPSAWRAALPSLLHDLTDPQRRLIRIRKLQLTALTDAPPRPSPSASASARPVSSPSPIA
jgi:hypothetical protein